MTEQIFNVMGEPLLIGPLIELSCDRRLCIAPGCLDEGEYHVNSFPYCDIHFRQRVDEFMAVDEPEIHMLVRLARERVSEDFSITSHGVVGEPSNGALLRRMATLLEESNG